MQIFVKTLSGRHVALDAKPQDSVLSLKHKIWDEAGIPMENQRLFFNEKILLDDSSLQDYSIENGSSVSVLLRLLGAGDLHSSRRSPASAPLRRRRRMTNEDIKKPVQEHTLLENYMEEFTEMNEPDTERLSQMEDLSLIGEREVAGQSRGLVYELMIMGFVFLGLTLLFTWFIDGSDMWWQITIDSLAGMFATGLGALPLFFVPHGKDLNPVYASLSNCIAAGVMVSASFSLLQEGFSLRPVNMRTNTLLGLMCGLFGTHFIHFLLHQYQIEELADPAAVFEQTETQKDSDSAEKKKKFKDDMYRRAILVFMIMTVHSCAEGLGIGVTYAGGEDQGRNMAIAIGIHNIPEGLAIALVLFPKGESRWSIVMYAIFSSFPQPLIAVPAYYAAEMFKSFLLAFGYGIAAGAMLWITFAEVLPEARLNVPPNTLAIVVILSLTAMLLFQTPDTDWDCQQVV